MLIELGEDQMNTVRTLTNRQKIPKLKNTVGGFNSRLDETEKKNQ